MYYRKIMIINQYLSAKNAATPARIQSSSDVIVGISNIITKFVEWPVVDRVPRRETTLYTGQLYIPFSGAFRSACGNNWIMGSAKYNKKYLNKAT